MLFPATAFGRWWQCRYKVSPPGLVWLLEPVFFFWCKVQMVITSVSRVLAGKVPGAPPDTSCAFSKQAVGAVPTRGVFHGCPPAWFSSQTPPRAASQPLACSPCVRKLHPRVQTYSCRAPSLQLLGTESPSVWVTGQPDSLPELRSASLSGHVAEPRGLTANAGSPPGAQSPGILPASAGQFPRLGSVTDN